MLVSEFVGKAHNEPLVSNEAPDYYLDLFQEILDYFTGEDCAVLASKLRTAREEYER